MSGSSIPIPERSRRDYVLLDGLRGVAALSVAVLHMPRIFDGYELPNAHLAVDFFLQLSGFIIASAYFDRIRAGMPFRDFVIRRFSRLFPAYIVGFALGLFVVAAALIKRDSDLSVAWTPTSALCAAVPNAVMAPQVYCPNSALLFPTNPPMWSIFHEFAINIAFFVGVVLMVRARTMVSAAIGIACLTAWLTIGDSLDVGYDWPSFLAGFARLSFSFLIGVGLYRLGIRVRKQSTVMSVAVAVALAVALNLQFESYLYEAAAVMVIFPAIVACGATVNPRGKAWPWVFSQLGAASYPLYAIHKPLYQLVYAGILLIAPSWIGTAGILLGFAVLGVISFCAWLLARHVEPRGRATVERILNRGSQRRQEEESVPT